jgi:Yip1 domain
MADAVTIINSDLQKQYRSHWLDIFFGLLISPIKTFNAISNPDLYSPHMAALLGSMLVVIICALADSCMSVNHFSSDEWIPDVISLILFDLFFWLVLAVFARLLAAALKVTTSMRSCLIVMGWAFVPLILKAPAACFSNVTMLGDILSLVVSFWFLVLIAFAFDSLFKLGKLKTLAFVFFLPPCLFVSYFVTMALASKFIFDGFF